MSSTTSKTSKTALTISKRTAPATLAEHYVRLAVDPTLIDGYSDAAQAILLDPDTASKVEGHLLTSVKAGKKDATKVAAAIGALGKITKKVGVEALERRAGIAVAVSGAFTGTTRKAVELAFRAGTVGAGKPFANAEALGSELGVSKGRVNQLKPADLVDKGGASSKGGRKVNTEKRVEEAAAVAKRSPDTGIATAVAALEAALENGLTITEDNREEMRRLSAALTLHAKALADLVKETAVATAV